MEKRGQKKKNIKNKIKINITEKKTEHKLTIKKTFWKFVESFKNINIHIIYLMLWDIFFYASTGLLFALIAKKFSGELNRLIMLKLNPEMIYSIEDLTNNIGILKRFFIFVRIIMVLLFVGMIILGTLSRGMIWSYLAKAKLTLRRYLRLLLLTTTWWLCWLIPIYLVFTFVKAEIFSIALFILLGIIIHFTQIIYYTFLKKEIGMWQAVKLSLKIGSG